MVDIDSNKKRDRKFYFFLHSEHQSLQEAAFQRVEVDIRYAEADWLQLSRDAAKLGYPAEQLLEKRLKQLVHTGNPLARIDKASERRRFANGYAQFWQPFVRYLIYAHITVLFGGVAFEYLFGFTKQYALFYWIYLLSLVLALVGLLGLKVKGLLEAEERPHQVNWMLRFEIAIATIAEVLISTSLGIFALSLCIRIVLGMNSAWPYFLSRG